MIVQLTQEELIELIEYIVQKCKDTPETELDEQDDGGGAGTSSAGEGAGTASMGVWDSGLTRGPANQVGVTKWSDSYQPTRGKGNPLW
tara:strand:- start:136 stop:399 length:264 start_codon:yes stop_codon:yes gene_type:complete